MSMTTRRRRRHSLLRIRSAFPVLLDPTKNVARPYRVDNLPMLLLIDRSGAIRYVHRNYRSGSDAQYLDQIRVLLDE